MISGIFEQLLYSIFTVITALTVTLFISRVKQFKDYLSKRKRTYIQKIHRKGYDNPHLFEFLKWKYKQEPVLQRCGKTYPVVVYPASKEQMQDVRTVLLSLLKEQPRDKDRKLSPTKFRKLLNQAGKLLIDNETFTVKEFTTEAKLGFNCELGSYFNCIDTCESLEWEILRKSPRLTSSNEAAFKKFDRTLRQRSRLHAKVNDPIRSGQHRSVALSISTLIVFNYKGTFWLWLQRRSVDVATHSKFLHIIPSFIFQKLTGDYEEEFSVRHNVYREYLEELFNVPEREAVDPKYFFGDNRLEYLLGLLKKGDAEFYFSGVAVSLMGLRHEICTVLLIRSEEWYKRHTQARSSIPEQEFKLNLEWDSSSRSIKSHRSVVPIPYKLTDEELMQWVEGGDLDPKNMVPVGAGSFWLGLDVLRQRLYQNRGRQKKNKQSL